MPVKLPDVFVMAQSMRSFRVPDINAQRINAQRNFQRRSGIVFLFSAMCLVSYPGWLPLYTRPARIKVQHVEHSTRNSF